MAPGQATGLSVCLHAAVVYLPFLQSAFSTVDLSIGDWLLCVAVASSALWLRELSKIIARVHSLERSGASPRRPRIGACRDR